MTSKLKYVLLTVIGMLGYTSLSFELIVLRQLINFMGSNTIITSIVVSFVLLFLSLGYYIGSVINFNKHLIRRQMIICADILCVWYMLACSYEIIGSSVFVIAHSGVESMVGIVFVFSTLFLALPSIFLGFITSAIGRFIHHFEASYTGRFMAVDTIGSVLGSLLTTLILMPFIGVSHTISVLCFITAIVSLLLSLRREPVYSITKFLLFTGMIVLMSSPLILGHNPNLIKDDAISRLEIEKNIAEDGTEKLDMYINGQLASVYSENREHMTEYVKYINKNIIESLPKDKINNILVLGAGGFTVGIDDNKNNYIYVDIEKHMKTITEQWFFKKKLAENKQFLFAEGYLFLLKDERMYDLIVVDVYSAINSIPENFITADFFELVKKHLNKNGIMVANIITSATFNNELSRRIDNTLRFVFPQYLTRQVINDYNKVMANILYIYYNLEPDNTIYTIDKNSALYGQMVQFHKM